MVYVFLADGFEELEALAPVDILRRADIEVLTVGVGSKTIIGAHRIPVACDIEISEATTDNLKAVILPGGMPGTTNLENSEAVQSFIDFAAQNNLIIGAICAAPSILGHKGLLRGKNAVCFGGFESELYGAHVLDFPAVRDENIITGWGAGGAFDFAFCLLEALTDKDTAKKLCRNMRYPM